MGQWLKDLFSDFGTQLQSFLSTSGLRIILAILTVIIGYFAIKILMRQINKRIIKKGGSGVLTSFMVSILRIILYTILFVIALTILGVPITSFLVVMGTASIAIGLAFQSTLANFFSGMVLIASRPFKIGDYVNLSGTSGTIKSIGIMNTTLITPDNNFIVLPNGQITAGAITNYSFCKTRRVEIPFKMAFGTDIDKVKKVILDMVAKHEYTITEAYAKEYNAKEMESKSVEIKRKSGECDQGKNAKRKRKGIVLHLDDEMELMKADDPAIRLVEIGEYSYHFSLRVWTLSDNFWSFFFELNELVAKTLIENGYAIPNRQLDVNLVNK